MKRNILPILGILTAGIIMIAGCKNEAKPPQAAMTTSSASGVSVIKIPHSDKKPNGPSGSDYFKWTGPEHIYSKVCGYCHETNVGPKLKDRNIPAEYVITTVRSGRNGMPSFRKSEISDADLKSLAKWLQDSKTESK